MTIHMKLDDNGAAYFVELIDSDEEDEEMSPGNFKKFCFLNSVCKIWKSRFVTTISKKNSYLSIKTIQDEEMSPGNVWWHARLVCKIWKSRLSLQHQIKIGI